MFNKAPQKINTFLDFIIEKRYVFATIFLSVSFSTFTFLYVVGLIPEEFKVVETSVQAETTEERTRIVESTHSKGRVNTTAPADATGEIPTRVTINKIGVNSIILNPDSTSVNVLNAALGRGAVRYPTSGKLGEGNLFLLGHSTNRLVVNNQAYKTFNNLEKLVIGDHIIVESATHIYTYRVFSVRLTDAEDALIQLKSDKNMLTISTCNSFGEKQERFVVEADFIKAELK